MPVPGRERQEPGVTGASPVASLPKSRVRATGRTLERGKTSTGPENDPGENANRSSHPNPRLW